MSVVRLPQGGAGGSAAAGECCPLCEQPIPVARSEAFLKRLADRDRDVESRVMAERTAAEQRLADVKRAAAGEVAAAVAAAERKAAALAGERLAAEARARQEAEQALAALRADNEARLAAHMRELREAADRDRVSAVQAEQAKAFDERQKLMAKIAELNRQLENKTAQDIGEPAEVDLFQMLKEAFPEDRIVRVEKGAAGADVIHDVHHNGRLSGRIVYDSKNRSAWRNEYVSKLRQDQTEAKADHAVLASKVFPSGVRELHVQEGVLVVSPARVAVIADLLRRHIVQTHALRLGNEARAAKTEALYAFIMSERHRQLMTSIDDRSDDLVDLDRKEEKAHQAVWKKRAEIIKQIQRAHGDLAFEVERIIGVAGNKPQDDVGDDGM